VKWNKPGSCQTSMTRCRGTGRREQRSRRRAAGTLWNSIQMRPHYLDGVVLHLAVFQLCRCHCFCTPFIRPGRGSGVVRRSQVLRVMSPSPETPGRQAKRGVPTSTSTTISHRICAASRRITRQAHEQASHRLPRTNTVRSTTLPSSEYASRDDSVPGAEHTISLWSSGLTRRV